ncbi:MAG TPA: pyridoxal-phosphate dependent enzyme, partial [Gammaproteobacteria bacterium]
MTTLSTRLTHFANPAAGRQPYPAELAAITSLAQAREAMDVICGWPGYAETPLYSLDALAERIGVGGIRYKDESQRFQLKSFKALGGAYAVARQLQQAIGAQTGVAVGIDDLLTGRYRELTADLVISCATDGNHGRSVAWGCRMFGCQCIIYIHRDVSAGRQQAIEAFGAEVVRVDGNYDVSVRQAARDAEAHGRIIVSDTSYPGYMEIPRDVALGYTVM